jgi:hypothetical protein
MGLNSGSGNDCQLVLNGASNDWFFIENADYVCFGGPLISNFILLAEGSLKSGEGLVRSATSNLGILEE